MHYLQKGSKRLFSQTTLHTNYRDSRCNSPGEAFHIGERRVALHCPIPEISEVTNRQTGRHTEYEY